MEEMEVKTRRSRRKNRAERGPLFDSITANPNDGLKVAFFVPMIIMVIIFIQRGIFPFGDQSFLRTDMYHQYAPFFSEFQHKLRTGGSLLYSWDIGMGVNFSALYAYYLASPMNWLILLCPKAYIIEFMTYMIVFKIGLSGLTFAWYLKKHCKTDSFGIGFFGIFYALSGYMAAYSWNIMWLDCILLFPLIVYGLEKMVREGNGFLYCITLGLSILSNYYISIMICIFMVLYFICLLIVEKMDELEDYGDAVIRFGVYSLLSGALAAVVLLPEIYALQSTASGDFNFPKTLTSYFSIFDMIARHLTCVETEIGLDHWPNIYCGVAVLMFFLLYLACKKVSVKEKAVYCGLLLVFFASFSTNMLNFIWHGFHYPNSLPARQSFIYIFLMLFVCFRAYMYLEDTPKKNINMAFWGSVSFVILAEKLVESDQFHFSIFYVAIILLSMYAGLVHLFKNGKRGLAAVLALLLVAVEAAANTAVTSVTITSREAYTRDNEEVLLLMDGIEDTEEFYRVEKKTRKTKNDGAWMNFPSVSLFSSTANADLTTFFKRMGCEASTNSYSITGSTPLIDSLVSIKYALYSEEVPNTELTEYRKESGGTYLYENLYTLPLGVVLPSNIDDDWNYKMDNPAEVQNDLCKEMGSEKVLAWVDSTTNGSTCKFTPDMDGEYYVYVTNKKVKKVKAALPGETKSFSNVDRGFLLELGNLVAGNEVTLTTEDSDQQLNCEVYRFSESAMVNVYEKLNEMPLVLTSRTDTELIGTVNASTGGVLFTSIPYETGWTVTVDGKEVKTEKIFDAFLAVDISEGNHEIVFKYFPEGLKTGAIISIAALGVLALLYVADQMMERRYRAKQAEKAAREAESMAETELEIEEMSEGLETTETDESVVPEDENDESTNAESDDVEADGQDNAEAKYTEENTDIKED